MLTAKIVQNKGDRISEKHQIFKDSIDISQVAYHFFIALDMVDNLP
jgi:hypothetical protein